MARETDYFVIGVNPEPLRVGGLAGAPYAPDWRVGDMVVGPDDYGAFRVERVEHVFAEGFGPPPTAVYFYVARP